MEDHGDSESQMMLEDPFSPNLKIDPIRARFPRCIVWTPLPVISWLVPFIGHMGICREDGVIMDFAGPNYVSVDNFAFGSVARYIQIDKEKTCSMIPRLSELKENEYDVEEPQIGKMTWDDALKQSTMEYQHHSYSLFTCNCHSYVANVLNRLGFQSGGWNVVNLASLMLLKGRWVNMGSMVRAYLPFVVVFCSGVLFGGSTFFTLLALFVFLLVGWFVAATYILKNVIML